jgi:hypothetical protein
MATYDVLINDAGLAMTAKPVDRNPSLLDASMDHWACTLRNTHSKRTMRVLFSMGSAHHGRPPELVEVLDCLASDAQGSDQSFEGWCAEYGYDSDSRKTFTLYRRIGRQANRLKALCGHHYDTLLYETERR